MVLIQKFKILRWRPRLPSVQDCRQFGSLELTHLNVIYSILILTFIDV